MAACARLTVLVCAGREAARFRLGGLEEAPLGLGVGIRQIEIGRPVAAPGPLLLWRLMHGIVLRLLMRAAPSPLSAQFREGAQEWL
jgi:hypothetical protein